MASLWRLQNRVPIKIIVSQVKALVRGATDAADTPAPSTVDMAPHSAAGLTSKVCGLAASRWPSTDTATE